jgi:hypothetical protein
MLILIASGAYLGTWIDRKIGGYWASIVCSLLGVGLALYLAIKEAIKMGNES